MMPLLLLSLAAGPFDDAEPEVAPSPREAQALTLDPGEAVVDFDVSPTRPEAALVLKGKILFWQIGGATRSVALPGDLKVSAISWHPLGRSLFLLATRGNQQEILQTPDASWAPTTLYRSKSPLRRLVVGPRPFIVGGGVDENGDEKKEEPFLAYRVFFGVKQANGKYAAHSVTEKGDHEYEVPGVALPAGFHPAGHLLLWEDDQHCFQKAEYAHTEWGESSKVTCGKGSLTYTPNGAGLLQWQRGADGVTLRLDGGQKTVAVAKGVRFESTPSSVADGRGIVGVTREGVRYVPIDVPLADVVNAWMFLENARDRELFSASTGLFRPLENRQLYELYDSENYDCGYYSHTTPTRPYLVTTDIFWELYAAAFEGTFILTEKQVAIPAFWRFVQGANESLKGQPQARAAAAFAALVAVRDGKESNPEAARILHSEGASTSSVTGQSFDFGNLKPRSHYDRDPGLQRYFRAFRYLTDLNLEGADLEPIRKLPRPVVQDAQAWIGAYVPFIAPPRERAVWDSDSGKAVFPLSWGMDNEVMFRTVFHPNLPVEEQITGPSGARLLPSGLDVAAVFGSTLAESLLEEAGEFKKYPPLRPRIAALRKKLGDSRGESLYQRWLSGLAAQWSERAVSPGGAIDKKLWSTKRLQTGLASWATLRHATLLVNQRSDAECGEAGFEPIVLRPPRGYVEPDPATFEAIAGLFDATIRMVESRLEDQPLRDGLVVRLTESCDKALSFRDIAKKELAGQPLTGQEYEEILYVGRAAEHNFLIFKSLAEEDFALSVPDPMGKVADVAGSTGSLLLAGVGAPLEWDQVIPFFGRREIVKGSSYSYYETVSAQVMTDAEWRQKLPGLARPKWIEPYVSPARLSCPARAP